MRNQGAEVETDHAFNGVVIFCICFFTVEIFCSSICKPKYFNSFFFYLDVLATMSLLLDIHEARTGTGPRALVVSAASPCAFKRLRQRRQLTAFPISLHTRPHKQILDAVIQQTPGESSHASALARAGRASKVGSKVGRILRLVRLIRCAADGHATDPNRPAIPYRAHPHSFFLLQCLVPSADAPIHANSLRLPG